MVLLVNGRPLALPWLAEHATTLVETWMLGVESGNAIADILFGRFPRGAAAHDLPSRYSARHSLYYSAYPTGRPADPDPTKDTARYIDQPITPQFAFGHGLSYSAFSTIAISGRDRTSVGAERVGRVSALITNTGKVAADEVVQLYVRDPVASVARPVMELRGFQRLALSPAKPGA